MAVQPSQSPETTYYRYTWLARVLQPSHAAVNTQKRVEWAELEKPQGNGAPSDYDQWCEKGKYSTRGLAVLREGALALQQNFAGQGEQDRSFGASFARDWVKWVIDCSHESVFLQAYVSQDNRWYDPKSPTPLTRDQWKESLPNWNWLQPERLTIPELEIALVLFDWSKEKPRFAWWVIHRPHITCHLHRFLLRHYSFELLDPFAKAAKQAGRDFVPFVAAPLRPTFLRIFGLIFVGLLGILGAGPLHDSLWLSGLDALWPAYRPWPAVFGMVALGLVLCILLRVICRVDVLKQNAGFLSPVKRSGDETAAKIKVPIRPLRGRLSSIWRWRHESPVASRRINLLWGTMALYGILGALVMQMLLSLSAASIPRFQATSAAEVWIVARDHPLLYASLLLRECAGGVVFGLAAALVGALLQWFWEEKSALDPV